MNNFWEKLNKPFFCLAPMADVTDAAFRRVIAKCGKPDVFWTEFVSADGLFYRNDRPGGRAVLMKDLIFTKEEKPIVAQFFTSKPEMMERAARTALELGFDGIDINMGCPDKSIEKQGAGASLCKNPTLARELIQSAKRGCDNKLPVSVKIRLGYNTDILESWLPELLDEEVAAVTIHARTRKEMSKVPARWERIKAAVLIRNELKSKTLIIGNGDVLSLDDARKKIEETGCDGVMLGKAIFGNPWLFANLNNSKIKTPTPREKLSVLVEHTNLFEDLLGDVKHFAIMKKHFKAYVSGWDGAKELRMKLMETNNSGEVEFLITEYLKKENI
ncbi:MAG: tRNA-dihydrouridine synthase [Patescibacteria group bacterium]